MSAYTAVLCDDESSIVEELSMAVRWDELGIEITSTASTGKEALNLILEKKPDIAVMDIRMPDMSGLEVMKQARESGLTTDFIILSGYNEFNYAREAIRVGAKAYLLKPLNITELYDELCHICADRAGHKPNAAYIKKLTENFIRNLIGGHIMSRDSLENMLATTGTVLHNGSSYCVCISWKNPILRSSAESTRILHVIESHAWKDPHFFLAYSENQIVGVCNCGAGDPSADSNRLLQRFAQENIPAPAIGIGDPAGDLLQIPYSYNRALTALTYQLYNANLGVYPWTVICTVAPKQKFSDIDCLPLVQCIVKNDREGIKKACQDFLTALMYVPMPAPNYLLGGCFSLCQRIDKEFSEWSHGDIQGLSTPRELYSLQSTDEILDWLIRRFTYLSGYIDAVYGYGKKKNEQPEEKIQSYDPLINNAVAWLKSHILDSPRIEDVAKEVHLSPSYFAIYFKKKTGLNLRDYMLREKMEYARIALLKPDTQVTELALTLGYNDYRSFSRAFKNINGITPSDFQARYRH